MSAFPDPQTILRDASMSSADKIECLRRAAVHARQIETANDEGMGGAVRASNLKAIQDALRELGVDDDGAGAGP